MSGGFLLGLGIGTVAGVIAGVALTIAGLYLLSWLFSGRAWPWRNA